MGRRVSQGMELSGDVGTEALLLSFRPGHSLSAEGEPLVRVPLRSLPRPRIPVWFYVKTALGFKSLWRELESGKNASVDKFFF